MFSKKFTALAPIESDEAATDHPAAAAITARLHALTTEVVQPGVTAIEHGIVLCGGSESGRLTIARSAALAAGVQIFALNATQMSRDGVGAKIQRQFYQQWLSSASDNAPAIAFLEAGNASSSALIDLLIALDPPPAPKRGRNRARQQWRRPAVVFVFSADTRELIDPALLRDGRAATSYTLREDPSVGKQSRPIVR